MVKQIKNGAATSLQFAKQLASVVVAFSLLGLGTYSVYAGREKVALALGAVALIFTGMVTVLVGVGLLYKTLMSKGQ